MILSDPDGKRTVSSVKIATATVNADSANVRGLENTESEKRVVKHLESAIKEKVLYHFVMQFDGYSLYWVV